MDMGIDLISFMIGLCAAPFITAAAFYIVYAVLDDFGNEKKKDKIEIESIEYAAAAKKPDTNPNPNPNQPINVNLDVNIEPIMQELQRIGDSNERQDSALREIRKATDSWKNSALHKNALLR